MVCVETVMSLRRNMYLVKAPPNMLVLFEVLRLRGLSAEFALANVLNMSQIEREQFLRNRPLDRNNGAQVGEQPQQSVYGYVPYGEYW